MDQTLILELSSDEEVGFDNYSTADNFDWITKLLNDVVSDNDHDDDHPISNGGIFNLGGCIGSGGGRGGGGDDKGSIEDDDDDDDSDDVVVVGENIAQNPNKTKALAPKIVVDDDDDDCVVLEGDPDKTKDVVKEAEEDSDELLIVGETGQVACRDYPHPRHLCAKFPFSSTPHESCCDMCHCYVCDSLAPCAHWCSGVTSIDHCHATDKEECWKLSRKTFRELKSPIPMPITKPGAASLPQLLHSQQSSTGPNQFMRPISGCRVPTTVGLPTIIRSRRSSIGVASNRFPAHLVSRQLVRNCNRNTQVQGNRGAGLASRMTTSHYMVKRSGLTTRPVVANRPTYHALNKDTVAYSQPPNQQLTENLTENNSTNSTLSSFPLDLDSSFGFPCTSSVSHATLPLQLEEYSQASQPSPHTPTSHFHGDHSTAVASNSPYAYASINQAQNVPGLALPCNTNAQNSITLCSEQQSAATHSISGPNFSCSTPDNLSSITQRSQQTSAEQSYSSPLFPCSAPNALNVTQSCQLFPADNSLVRDEMPMHEYLPSMVQNVQPVDNSHNTEQLENLEFDFENWLQSSEHILGSQEESLLLDMNNQVSGPPAVDAGMLYFDFETSWKGLAHS